jgi:hypothetical protein
MSVTISMLPGLLRPMLKPTRGRPRLPTPERIERRKAVQKAWVGRNQDYVTAQRNQAYVSAQCKRLGTRPEYRERRRELYNGKQLLLEPGFVPRPRGRPRLYEAEEALERKRTRARESIRYSRALARGTFNEPAPLN